MAFAVHLEKLGFQYENKVALTDVSLSVEEGSFVAFLGPNGGGKSTLFKILSTLLRPGSGEVKILGYSLLSQPEEIRRKIGVVFQNPSLDLKLSVEENLLHHGPHFGLSGRVLRTKVDGLLSQFDLSDRRKNLCETLSGGLKRRVEIAKGLINDPRLLLLDEPTTGLDPDARKSFWEIISDLRTTTGMTIATTTHLLDEAENCDKVGILVDGSLKAFGNPDALTAEVGDRVISVRAHELDRLSEEMGASGKKISLNEIRFGGDVEAGLLSALLAKVGKGNILSVSVAKPDLGDFFTHVTGRRFTEGEQGVV